MNVCPHCGSSPCLPLWRKLCLGPAASARCRECGFRVGVDVAKACIALLPTLALVLLAGFGVVRDPVLLIVLLPLCLFAMFFLYAAWVPLKPDEFSDAGMVAAARERIGAQRGAASTRK